MNLNEKAILWLDIFQFLTLNKKVKILELFEQPKDIFTELKNKEKEILNIVNLDNLNEMLHYLKESIADRFLETLKNKNIGALTYISEKYPSDFLNYENPPLVLYYKGNLNLINTKSVAVVGTRRVTRYGERVTQMYCEELVKNKVTIVSGMAEGVDTIAHKTALKHGGNTIAVLGCGFDQIYPSSNIELFNEIAKCGLVLSEYSPITKAQTYHFPQRNRIIVACSDAVLITEAGIKSGAMHTKNYCLDYGKDLFVVPGNIDSEYSKGTNAVLKAMQGALTTSPEDILESLGVNQKHCFGKEEAKYQLSIDEKLVIDIIGSDEVHFDEILNTLKLDTKTLLRLLTTLELNGIIKKLAGNYYSK